MSNRVLIKNIKDFKEQQKEQYNMVKLIADYMVLKGESLQIDCDVNNLDDTFLNLVATKVNRALTTGTFTNFEDVIKYQLTLDLVDETNGFAKKKYLLIFDALSQYEEDHHIQLNLDDNNLIDEAYATLNRYRVTLEFKGLERLLELMTNGKDGLAC